MVLMLCLVLSGVFSYAHGAARTENGKGEDGIPIDVMVNQDQATTKHQPL